MKPKKRWIPKAGEKYWYISIQFNVEVYYCQRTNTEHYVNYKLNCFKTKKPALEAARKIRKLLS